MVAGASPALVSSLLIHGDQSVPFDVWLSVCPFHTRRAVVNSAFCCATQLPFQFRLVALCCAFTIKSAGRGVLDYGLIITSALGNGALFFAPPNFNLPRMNLTSC